MRIWLWLGLLVVAAGMSIGGIAQAASDDGQAVRMRAEKLWAAEGASDWGAVYDVLSVTGREGQTRDEYIANRRTIGPFHYPEAKVDEVFVADNTAWVHVRYKYAMVAHPLVPPQPGEHWQIWQKQGDWYAAGPSERALWPRLPPSLRPAAEEAALATRSRELWQAKAAQDWKSVYPYLHPDYRAEVQLDSFLTRKAKYLYFTPRVDWAEVEGDAGRVKVVFAQKIADPAASKMEPNESMVIEKWRKAGGEWFLDVYTGDSD